MSEWDRQQEARKYEGWAFTFCKAGFLVVIFQKHSLLALSGLSLLFYVMAIRKGCRDFRCWAKPPWVVIWWGMVFLAQLWRLFRG